MTSPRPITEDELQAYVDGALDASRREEVADYLRQHPQAARRIDGYMAQRAALRAALAPIADEPVPSELNLRSLLAARRARAAAWRPAIAAALTLCVGAALGWAARGVATPDAHGVPALAREAAENYRVYAADTRRPVEIPAADQAALVQWVSNRLGSPISVPDLRAAGYRFIGGRLVTTPNGPAAMFIYDGAEGARLAVLSRPMRIEKDTRMSEQSDGGLGRVSWAARGIGYSVVGQAPAAALHPLADEVRRQVESAV